MLRLRLNGLYSKRSERKDFLKNIFLFVLLVHLFFFGSMILISIMGKKQDKFTILMHQAGATYVLMPLQKKIDQNGITTKKGSSRNASKSQVLGYDEYSKRKKNSKKDINKNLVSKQKPSNTKEEKQKSKKITSKATAVLADKKHMHKKNKHKQLSSKKNKIKIVEQKKEELPKVATQQVTKSEQEEALNQVSPEITSSLENEQNSSETTLSPISDNVIFVGYEQFDECVIGSKIQHEIIQNWTPPVGLEQAVCCEMRIVVSPQGIADSIEIIKSSGVLVFDMSARTSLQQIEFPKEVYGKTIMIALGN